MNFKISKQSLFIIIFLVLVSAASYHSFFIELYPQKSNTDLWTHLAIINELKADSFSDINAPFYSLGERDPRGGFYLATVAIVSKIFDISTINTYLFFGLINVNFFLISAFIFARHFFKRKKLIFLFPVLLLFLWGSGIKISAGMFSFNEILWMGPFLHFFIFGLLLLGLIFSDRFLKDEKFQPGFYLTALILGWIIFNSHMLTGALFFCALLVLIVARLIENKKINMRLILLFFLPLMVFVINLVWPLYDQWHYFFGESKPRLVKNISSSVGYRGWDYYLNYFKAWLTTAGLSLLGVLLILHFKKKNIFFLLLFILSASISLFGLTNFRISFYWRFYPLLVLAGTAGWLLFFQRTKARIVLLLASGLLVIGVFHAHDKIEVFKDWLPYTYQQNYYAGPSYSFDIISNLPRDSVVFTDEMESHVLSGLTGFNVVGVRPQHASFVQSAGQAEGYNDIIKAFQDPVLIDMVINKYNISYLLLKNHPAEDDLSLSRYVSENFPVVNNNNSFTLYSSHFKEE